MLEGSLRWRGPCDSVVLVIEGTSTLNYLYRFTTSSRLTKKKRRGWIRSTLLIDVRNKNRL